MSELRYFLASFLLKTFSTNRFSRKVYRALGNRLGTGKHSLTTPEAVQRGFWFIDMVEQSGVQLTSDSTVLEIGSGWTHFYGIFLHFFVHPRTYLFDIWDNRQLNAVKEKYTHLADAMRPILPSRWHKRFPEIEELTRKISLVNSFDELYALMNMTYCIEPEGRLEIFPSHMFDMVFSGDVLEHIQRSNLDGVIQNIHRILKPGGVSIHQIGIDDHLTHYAPGMSSKNYVRYPEKIWKLLFENQVQYFNRVQAPEFLESFTRNGFQLVSCSTEEDVNSLKNLTPASEFQHFDRKTLQTTRAYMVHTR